MKEVERRGQLLGDDANAVLGAAREGDPIAWRRLYDSLAGRVAGYLRTQGAYEPEDLTSEVFLAVIRNFHTFVGSESQFRSWVFVIAHRRLLDERRRRSRREAVPLDDAFLMVAGDVEHDAMALLGTDRVNALCERLAPDQRDVLLLRLIGDLTIEQVADVLGKSPGAVKALQRRALAAIQRMTQREGVTL
jgi:RNA polymerase sigma-70 factor (ECF subfamily)